jgi:hypothetical protein
MAKGRGNNKGRGLSGRGKNKGYQSTTRIVGDRNMSGYGSPYEDLSDFEEGYRQNRVFAIKRLEPKERSIDEAVT